MMFLKLSHPICLLLFMADTSFIKQATTLNLLAIPTKKGKVMYMNCANCSQYSKFKILFELLFHDIKSNSESSVDLASVKAKVAGPLILGGT